MGHENMRVFAALDRDKVEKVLEVLSYGIASDPLYDDRMEDLQKMGFTSEQARVLINWFYDFYIGTRNPDLMIRMLEAENADGDSKRMAIDTFRRIVDGRKWPDESHDAELAGAQRDPNEDAFDRFVYEHRDDPEFKGKFVAFVHGKYRGCGASENDLILEMEEKFGDVDMMVGPVTTKPNVLWMRPPELT